MINWKKEAIDELKSHAARKEAVNNLAERIACLQNQLYHIGACQISERVGGSAGNSEDTRLSMMVELEELKARKLITEKRVQLVQRCLSELPEEHKLILSRFYIERPQDYIEELEEVLYMPRATIYREKDKALHRLVELMYGIGVQ